MPPIPPCGEYGVIIDHHIRPLNDPSSLVKILHGFTCETLGRNMQRTQNYRWLTAKSSLFSPSPSLYRSLPFSVSLSPLLPSRCHTFSLVPFIPLAIPLSLPPSPHPSPHRILPLLTQVDRRIVNLRPGGAHGAHCPDGRSTRNGQKSPKRPK